MQVLDLGSGKGATSVFLAREYGVQVVAADWWITADEAAAVFAGAGVAGQVTAVRAEAHDLPFGHAVGHRLDSLAASTIDPPGVHCHQP